MALIENKSIEVALNNLDEADFNLKDISVVMKDEKASRLVSDDVGPLKGVTKDTIKKKLKILGVSSDDINTYMIHIQNNEVLIAIEVTEDLVDNAKAMLEDYKPVNVLVVKEVV